MFIDTRAIGFGLTDAIQRHVETRVESALGRFSPWVVRVTVRLDDVNADRGGDDKRCSIVVSLRNRGAVVAEAIRSDLYVAVDEVAARVRRSVERSIKRHLTRDRRDRQRPGALVTL
jgi:putative sigma-54 modulation protein